MQRGLEADEQVKKNVKKAEQGGYVRSLVAVLALLAVGFFGVRVSFHELTVL
jgi:hypothetical protein